VLGSGAVPSSPGGFQNPAVVTEAKKLKVNSGRQLLFNSQHRTALCVAVLLVSGGGCHEPLRLTYDIAGERVPLYTSDVQTRVAKFQGSGDWEIEAVASVPVGQAEDELKVDGHQRVDPPPVESEAVESEKGEAAKRKVGKRGPRRQRVRRTYPSDGDQVRIILADFLTDRTLESLADGRYKISFGILKSNAALPTATLILDRRKPQLAVLLADGKTLLPLTSSHQIEVAEDRLQLFVEDASPLVVEVNGLKVTPGSDGFVTVSLAGVIEKEIQFSAEDAAGNSHRAVLSVARDRSAPTVRLARPLARRTYDPVPSVAFAVSDDVGVASVQLHVNGKPVPAQSTEPGEYNAILPFESGVNRFTLHVADRAGREVTMERSIELARLPERVLWDVRGTDGILYTRDPHELLAEIRSAENLVLKVSTRFRPFAAASEEPVASEVELVHHFPIESSLLRLHLADVAGPTNVDGTGNETESGGHVQLAEGRYSFRFSGSANPERSKLPEAVMVYDTTPPDILLETSAKLVRLPQDAANSSGEQEEPLAEESRWLVAADHPLPLRVGDLSGPCVVTVNGRSLQPDFGSVGLFSLPPLEGRLSIVAQDAAGNSSKKTLHVQLDSGAPTVEFVGIPAEGRTRNSLTTVTLQAHDDDGVVSCELSHNGRPVGTVTTAEGFQAQLYLLDGANTLRAEVVDRLGQTGTATVRLVCLLDGSPAEQPGHVFQIQRPDGTVERWAVPSGIEIRESPAMAGRFQVSTGNDRQTAMVLVEGGRGFLPDKSAGDGEREDGESTEKKPQESDSIPPFLIDCFEVTVERFTRFAPDWVERLPASSSDPQQPAVIVSWDEAQAFAAWAGKHLPTTTQWELAASWDGTARRRYPWGNRFDARRLREVDSSQATELDDAILAHRGPASEQNAPGWLPYAPKATLLGQDVSPWSAVGLAGGVREWCRDATGGRPGDRAVRGGSVVHPRDPLARVSSFSPDLFRTDRTGAFPRTVRRGDLGFRCVLELLPVDVRVANNER
jgi:formylglycine-generating enzyme required for sulfatase activity